jgi:hypothetical protein
VDGFLQYNERLAVMKIKVKGGRIGVVTGYAPHNLRPCGERQLFYTDLGCLLDGCSVNGPVYLFGDFNSKLGARRPGEEDILGQFCYGREAAHKVEVSNRDLLIEFCTDRGYMVVNTFIDAPPDKKVTYFKPGAAPMGDIVDTAYHMIDFFLAPPDQGYDIVDLMSVRDATMPTDHYLVKCRLKADCGLHEQRARRNVKDRTALKIPAVRKDFVDTFQQHCGEAAAISAEESWNITACAFKAAESVLPPVPTKPHKPWIRQSTINMIEARAVARRGNDYPEEKKLHKLIRKAARADRTAWVSELLAPGTWDRVKQYRKPKQRQQGRLRDLEGVHVSSEERAETMAKYLESVQWKVRPPGLFDATTLGDTLPVELGGFTKQDVVAIIKKLKDNIAAGADGIPAEYVKAVASDETSLTWLTDCVNACWHGRCVPSEWHLAQVSMIHKKGSVDVCDNYRPISLLSIGYKIFAALILKRLVDAGSDDRLSQSQFGFKRGSSTTDAIFALRRKVEFAWAQRDGRLMVLALDWKKAFDAINPDALMEGLRRFGLPKHVVEVIAAIYKDRTFQVRDCGQLSSTRQQNSGISQGCPLSPYLFVIIMTVLMKDAAGNLCAVDADLLSRGGLAELLYADDTLLLSVSANSLERFLRIISEEGCKYGLELHWGKLQLMQIRCNEVVHRPDGTAIEPQPDLLYLGTAVADDGRIGRELARRLGMASSEFRSLDALWRHTSLGRDRKTAIFNAVVIPRLLYSLSTACLNIAEKRRLDGFQNRCLRRIWGIGPSYLSRVRNADVLQTSQQRPLSDMILEQQLIMFGKAARAPIFRQSIVYSQFFDSQFFDSQFLQTVYSDQQFFDQDLQVLSGQLLTGLCARKGGHDWNGLRKYFRKLPKPQVDIRFWPHLFDHQASGNQLFIGTSCQRTAGRCRTNRIASHPAQPAQPNQPSQAQPGPTSQPSQPSPASPAQPARSPASPASPARPNQPALNPG